MSFAHTLFGEETKMKKKNELINLQRLRRKHQTKHKRNEAMKKGEKWKKISILERD